MYQQNNAIGEREALTDLLTGEKHMMNLYTTALMESSSPQMRGIIEQNLSELSKDQYGVYANMSTRGYYTIKPATPQMISEAACEFESLKQQL
jgi:spore coat protein F